MSERTIALVTGANKGIGYEIARGLGALGWSVGVDVRDDQRRTAAVERLCAAGVDAFGVPLDLTDDASVTAAARLIASTGGACGISGSGPSWYSANTSRKWWVRCPRRTRPVPYRRHRPRGREADAGRRTGS